MHVPFCAEEKYNFFECRIYYTSYSVAGVGRLMDGDDDDDDDDDDRYNE
jgi:hypothetical protein